MEDNRFEFFPGQGMRTHRDVAAGVGISFHQKPFFGDKGLVCEIEMRSLRFTTPIDGIGEDLIGEEPPEVKAARKALQLLFATVSGAVLAEAGNKAEMRRNHEELLRKQRGLD